MWRAVIGGTSAGNYSDRRTLASGKHATADFEGKTRVRADVA
jgi:hypothetical protein